MARTLELLARPGQAEVEGRYLHWDELRRHPVPVGLTHREWWFQIDMTRRAMRAPLALRDKQGRPFCYATPGNVLEGLHRIDRELGNHLESTAPQLGDKEIQERYIVRSLMEEAITSSQLEGASTTRKVAKEMLVEKRQPRTKSERMISNNFQAMEWLRRQTKERLSISFLRELHEILTQDTLEADEVGRLRRADEQVTVMDQGDGEVLHIPPEAEALPERLKALCAFANEEGANGFVHPVVRAIALHFALGYEHPFVDGNGRTARALFYWSMIRQGYWIAEFLPISRILQRAPVKYGRAFLFTETDSNDLTYFLLHQLEVLRYATEDLYVYLRRKQEEALHAEQILRREVDLNHRQRELLLHALRHPTARYDIDSYRRQHSVVYQTARQDLLDLEAAGLLRKVRVGRAYSFSPVSGLQQVMERKKAR
ncbi:Fic family protein [Myxococcus sp. XM-1-1-1]|uniref:Fic family protein n=1 Tax=Myxococcus sp. XM-1-1-1 TaxID=2874602 RepID=UPI001CBD3981